MRLELANFPVQRIRLGERTAWADGILTVGVDEVRRLVLADPRLGDVGLEVVHPGDSARVLRALDAVEPLCKVAGPGCAFPGFLGPPDMAGRGRTHRLAGLSVVAVTEFPGPARGVHAFEEGLIEMSGPGAAFSAGSDRANLLLLLAPGAAADNVDYDDAVRRATLRVASALAAVTRDLPPPEVQVFELGPVAAGTPRVVWVHQVRAQGPMVVDLRRARVALVTEGGLVPRGNPDRLEWVRASRWLAYSLAGVDDLAGIEHDVIHGGYDAAWVREDPDRLLPVDVLREMVESGAVGELLDAYYVTCGNHGILAQMARYAREIAGELRRREVDAVLLVAT